MPLVKQVTTYDTIVETVLKCVMNTGYHNDCS